MQLIRLDAAVIFGIVIPQISSISISPPPSDCLTAVKTCMSNLCRWSKESFHGSICEGEGCKIKGSLVCNLTIQTIMDQFPSLRGCVCAWEEEEELCDSIQALATQCQKKTAAQQKRSTLMDWQSSSLIGYGNYLPAATATLELFSTCVCVIKTKCGPGDTCCIGNYYRICFEYFTRYRIARFLLVNSATTDSTCECEITSLVVPGTVGVSRTTFNCYDRHRDRQSENNTSITVAAVHGGSASCLDQIRVCVSDAVCNRYLVPVLQACMAQQCHRCQLMTQQFYGSMPHNVAEMLVMCECKASDQTCLDMKTSLHSGTCGGHTRICQDTVKLCVKDRTCRDLIKTFRAKCWRPEETQCSNTDLQNDDCISQMDPALILGADPECKMAFLATLGTALHYPCSCEGLRNEDLLTCNRIHDVFHNRSHFTTYWKSSSGPTKPPKINESEQGHTGSHDYLLYTVATVLLFGVVILMPLAVVSKIWTLRRRDKTKFHHPQKSNCVVIL